MRGNKHRESCTILTNEASEGLRPVSDKLHIILHPETYDLRLDYDVRIVKSLKELSCPYSSPEMIGYPVSSTINSPRNQGEKLISRLPINFV
jgi:putative SOS response-associated peptidase YedK